MTAHLPWHRCADACCGWRYRTVELRPRGVVLLLVLLSWRRFGRQLGVVATVQLGPWHLTRGFLAGRAVRTEKGPT